jgi:hypothetical protein
MAGFISMAFISICVISNWNNPDHQSIYIFAVIFSSLGLVVSVIMLFVRRPEIVIDEIGILYNNKIITWKDIIKTDIKVIYNSGGDSIYCKLRVHTIKAIIKIDLNALDKSPEEIAGIIEFFKNKSLQAS